MTDHNLQLNPAAQSTGPRAPGMRIEGTANTPFPTYRLSSASSYADLQYLFGVQDLAMITQKTARNRRKSAQGPDHVKHRRTRSGCFTCRSRRVKCDESRPICERCKKGGRECNYPEPTTTGSKSSSSSSSKAGQPTTQSSPGSESEEYDDDDDDIRLESIQDQDEEQDAGSQGQAFFDNGDRKASAGQPLPLQQSQTRLSSETPSLIQDDKGISPSPSTEGSVGYVTSSGFTDQRNRRPIATSLPRQDRGRENWAHLPQDLQFYLEYFVNNVTHHHYALKHDSDNFMHTRLLDAAMKNDSLLHAIVGFSAFQHTLHNPEGRIQDFLQYYNKAVSLLLRSLKRGERRAMGTLLAILQLATIEEYLGDWINLLGHQKAAYEILTHIFTPQTVMQSETSRVILAWYSRFDVFAGLMGGFETVLSREWFSWPQEYFARRVLDEPDNINWKIEEAVSSIRLVAMEMSILFSRRGKGEISHDQFLVENEIVEKKIRNWKNKMDPALRNPQWLVSEFKGARIQDLDDIVDPYVPGILYDGPLWSMNICSIDWYSVLLMHKYQTALTLQQPFSPDLAMTALATCQLFEAIEYYPGSPKGSVLACQASLGIAAIFLPRDHAHTMWCRRKFAVVESAGFIFPLTFRTKMAELLQDQSIMHWWLPNDENYPPMIRSIRNFVEERTSSPRDNSTEDLRDMKAIFSSMNLDDGRSQASSQETPPDSQTLSSGGSNWTSGYGEDNTMAMGYGDLNPELGSTTQVNPFESPYEYDSSVWGSSTQSGKLVKKPEYGPK